MSPTEVTEKKKKCTAPTKSTGKMQSFSLDPSESKCRDRCRAPSI